MRQVTFLLLLLDPIPRHAQLGAASLAEVNHLNSRAGPSRPGLDHARLLSSVPPHILAKILRIFHLDFVLFGYDKEPLLRLLEEKEKVKES